MMPGASRSVPTIRGTPAAFQLLDHLGPVLPDGVGELDLLGPLALPDVEHGLGDVLIPGEVAGADRVEPGADLEGNHGRAHGEATVSQPLEDRRHLGPIDLVQAQQVARVGTDAAIAQVERLAEQRADQLVEAEEVLAARQPGHRSVLDRDRLRHVPDHLESEGLGLVDDGEEDVGVEDGVHLDHVDPGVGLLTHRRPTFLDGVDGERQLGEEGRVTIEDQAGGPHLRPEQRTAVQLVPQLDNLVGGHRHVAHEQHTVGEHRPPEHRGIEEVDMGVDQPRHQVATLTVDRVGTAGDLEFGRVPDPLDTIADHHDGLPPHRDAQLDIDDVHVDDRVGAIVSGSRRRPPATARGDEHRDNGKPWQV